MARFANLGESSKLFADPHSMKTGGFWRGFAPPKKWGLGLRLQGSSFLSFDKSISLSKGETWHLHWLRLLGTRCHRHIHVGQIVLTVNKKVVNLQVVLGGERTFKYNLLLQIPLTHVLEGSERELGAHPQPPSWPDVGHNLNLGERCVLEKSCQS